MGYDPEAAEWRKTKPPAASVTEHGIWPLSIASGQRREIWQSHVVT